MKEIIIEVPDRFGQELKPEKVNSEIKRELVRCKDCKYFPSAPQYEPSCWKNRRHGDDQDWFCADGEKR